MSDETDDQIAELDRIDQEYGTGGDPCPFCGGMLGTGHNALTRRDGQVTRCQVGDVRGLSQRLRKMLMTPAEKGKP